jgi:hypothetical protein
MPSEKPNRLGVSSRRSACDRCRGQKLRCLREREEDELDTRCERCKKADAQCISTPIYHMRNAFAHGRQPDDLEPSKKRRRRDKSPNSHFSVVKSSQQEPTFTLSTTTSNTMYNHDHILNDNFNPSLNPNDFTSRDRNWTKDTVSAPLNYSEASHVTLEHTSVGYGLLPQPLISSPQPYIASQLVETEDWPCLDFGLVDSESQINSCEASTDGNNSSHSSIEELSKMNVNLVKQLKRMELPHVNIKTLVVPDCSESSGSMATPLEDILNSTRMYLDTLSVVAGAPRSPQSSVSDAAKLAQRYSGYLGTSSSNVGAPHDILSDTSSPSAAPSDTGAERNPLDKSVLLLILICYVHILRLHVGLFRHIAQYLQFVSESAERTVIPLPSLCGFSNFPLSMFSSPPVGFIALAIN